MNVEVIANLFYMPLTIQEVNIEGLTVTDAIKEAIPFKRITPDIVKMLIPGDVVALEGSVFNEKNHWQVVGTEDGGLVIVNGSKSKVVGLSAIRNYFLIEV